MGSCRRISDQFVGRQKDNQVAAGRGGLVETALARVGSCSQRRGDPIAGRACCGYPDVCGAPGRLGEAVALFGRAWVWLSAAGGKLDTLDGL